MDLRYYGYKLPWFWGMPLAGTRHFTRIKFTVGPKDFCHQSNANEQTLKLSVFDDRLPDSDWVRRRTHEAI